MAGLLLAIVLIGFSRTFYLRWLLEVPDRPLNSSLVVHGVVLTTWFILLYIQTLLIGRGDTRLHRRFGWFGAVVAAAVIGVAIIVTLGLASRPQASAQIVIVDFASLIIFATLVSIAVALRRRSSAHKRLMLLASIAIIGPALAAPRWRMVLDDAGLAGLAPWLRLSLLVLLAAMFVNDWMSLRRIHAATLYGVVFILLTVGGAIYLANTDLGRSWVAAPATSP
jgi:hypothetical protein